MLDKTIIFTDIKKRNSNFSRLNLEEVEVLQSSQDPEYITKEFEKILLKLFRLVSYSTIRNNKKLSSLEQDTNNLIKKLINSVKYKITSTKSKYEKKAFFDDICRFINFFDWDSYFTKIHNSIPKTSINKFNNKNVSEQFFQMSYWRNWWIDWMPEWWCCSYRTILLYNFFKKLKEAWLDLEIKFFRFKNLEDNILWEPSMRHSWLIISFQWEDYFVDHEGIHVRWVNEWKIIRKVNDYILKPNRKNTEIINEMNDFFGNFQHWKMAETDKVIFFDNVEDFMNHYNKYPPYSKIAFYRKNLESNNVDKISFEFITNWIWIAVNWKWNIFYLSDNDFTENNIKEKLYSKIAYVKNSNWCHKITKEEKDNFIKFFNTIKDKISFNLLYSNFKKIWAWENIIADLWWKDVVVCSQK